MRGNPGSAQKLRQNWPKWALMRLKQIGDEIARDTPTAARVVARLVSLVETLAKQPASGRVGRIADTRELALAGITCVIACRIVASELHILNVLHAAQTWPDHI